MAVLDTAVIDRQRPAEDRQAKHAKPDGRRFAMLVAPLALLLVTFKVFVLEEPAFFSLACLVFGGFVVCYWLPFRFKEPMIILLSLGGAYLLLPLQVASLLIATGLILFAVIRSGLAYRWRVLILLVILGVLSYGRATGRFPIQREFWPVFGSVFLFRMIVYLYDLKHQRGPARFKEYLAYFFLLPNYYFVFFPVIDFQTFQKSYYARDIHLVAAQGVWRIFRGTTHLLFYRLVYQFQGLVSPPRAPAAVAVAVKIICCYLLYVRISGQFHIITGMLHLFGYDLPETNRWYFLSRGLADFWRRINIYWKDFMVKVVYFPTYFKLRRKGDLQAQLVATALVFVATWFLHAFLFFWLQGRFRITLNDSLFWFILGTLFIVDVWMSSRRRKRQAESGWRPRLLAAAQIVGTFALIATAWSMWSATSFEEWFYFLRTGNTE